MLTLLTYPRNGAVFSLSPFCVKAALLLTYAKLPWQREDLDDPRRMPHRKLPVLRTGSGLIPDSDDIRRYLERQGVDFDPGLSVKQKAQAQAFISMAEDSLYFYVVRDRWDNDLVWPTIRDTYFQGVPALIRRPVTGAIRRSVHQGLQFQGIGRFTDSDRMGRLDRQLQAISEQLGDGAFLMGDHLTSADLSVSAMLQALRSTMINTPTVERIVGDPVLNPYVDRVFQEALVLPNS